MAGHAMTEKNAPDWELIETDYRAGIKSLRQMGSEYGVSHVGIKKRAERDGWVRDLSSKIKAKTEAKVTRAAVTTSVTTSVTTETASEKEVVEANAEMQANIILTHRSDIRKLRDAARVMAVEVETCNESLSKRVGILKSLSDTQKTLIGLEREAFGIDSNKSVGQTLDDFLDSIGS